MLPSSKDRIHNDVLRKLIQAPEVVQTDASSDSQSGPPQSRVEQRLARIDVENILAGKDEEAEGLGMKDIPGGQLTFVFERKSIV